ncbi:MAG: PEP-CTERM sorting domain-containing protein [Desulfobulbaceae bacterium]|nr:PEP-CTERM sorting domain-containing protein [Desulfobulbaceae bacterium]
MDDLTDLWLVNTLNIDASALDVLLDNLATIEGTDTEGILYMTQANFDGFGELLATWDAEPGHHVEILILGDMDGDGVVDFDDINAFALGLIDPRDYEDLYGMHPEWKGDSDADGDFDFDDIPGFVEMLGGVSAVPEPTSLLLVLVGIVGLAGVRRRIV